VLVALLALLLAPAQARGDKPVRGGASSSVAGAETEPSSAVFPLYGDVYPHGCVPPSSPSLSLCYAWPANLFPPIPRR